MFLFFFNWLLLTYPSCIIWYKVKTMKYNILSDFTLLKISLKKGGVNFFLMVAGFFKAFPANFKISLIALLVIFLLPLAVSAQKGPGLGNLTYNSNEYFKSIWRYTEVNHYGSNIAIMHNGYLVTTFTPDSGKPPGGILVWDVSNPRSPKLVKRIYDERTASLREAHGISTYDDYILFQDGCGFQIWDFSNPADPILVKRHCITGYGHDDYGSAWQIFWQAPYVFIGNGSSGFDVVDASDINNPVFVKHVNVGMQAGPIFAVGNLLITTAHDTGVGAAIFDISDPKNPQLVNSYTATERMYAGFVNGNRIITSARGNSDNSIFSIYDFSDQNNIIKTGTIDIGNSGEQLYSSTQDQYIFQGVQQEIVKIDASDPSNLTIAGRGNLGISGDSDHGQVSPFGNLIFVGNDHGTGSGFIVHQTAPDTKGPEANMIVPRSNSVNRALTSRIGLSFTDNIDLTTVNNETFIVRLKGGGSALTGRYSHQFSILNFSPNSPLLPNSTYEVVLPAGGIKDYAGNSIAETYVSYFSTGPSGDFPPAQPGNVIIYEEDKKVSLFWENVANATEFIIKRSHSLAGPFDEVATTTQPNFIDTNVENNTLYYYQIVPLNSFGEGTPSSSIKAIPSIYITDLTWVSTINEWGPVEVDQSNGEQPANDGRTITLNGEKYSRGLGIHANAEVVYDLDGAYRRFISDVGVDDEVGNGGSVNFEVWTDGVLAYSSGAMTGLSETQRFDLNVLGVQELKIVVTDEGAPGMDHASLGGARLIPVNIPNVIPGIIQAENFADGGEGVAYHDNEAENLGGAYRNEGVDLQQCSEGGYNIGFARPGEWVEYTATAQKTADYHLKVRVAAITDVQTMYLEVDGVNVTGTFTVPNTGGWQSWQDLMFYNIPVTEGVHTLRLVFVTGSVNVNYFEFEEAPELINPYIRVNGGAWESLATAVVCGETGNVTFGPHPLTGGTWSWKGPQGFTASTREVYLENLSSAQSGIYTATYSCGSGCSDSYDFSLSVDVCTGSPAGNNDLFSIYPNPVTDEVTIYSPVSIKEISVVDSQGKQVLFDNEEFVGSKTLNVKGLLETGIYFIKIRDAENINVHKIIVK